MIFRTSLGQVRVYCTLPYSTYVSLLVQAFLEPHHVKSCVPLLGGCLLVLRTVRRSLVVDQRHQSSLQYTRCLKPSL